MFWVKITSNTHITQIFFLQCNMKKQHFKDQLIWELRLMNGGEFRLSVCMNRQIPSKRWPGISSSNEGTKMNGDCFRLSKWHLYLFVCRRYCALYCLSEKNITISKCLHLTHTELKNGFLLHVLSTLWQIFGFLFVTEVFTADKTTAFTSALDILAA